MAISMLDGGSLPSSFKPRSKPRQQSRGSRPSPPPTPRPSPPRNVPSPRPGPISSISSPPPAPRPKAPSVKSYLSGDEVYQQALRGGKRSLRDFLSELARRRTEAKTTFGQTTEQLEVDRERQLEQLRNEFASRGLLQSSLFAGEQGRFQEDFQTQQQALQQAQQQLLADLVSQQTNFRREQELAMEAARAEALARRASRFNIGV